jgi:hypothetical protein
MTKTLVNRTLPIVWEEANLLGEHFPNHDYQAVVGNPQLRQELIAYVLSRIPNTYSLQEIETDIYPRGQTTAQRLEIERLLQQGMCHLSLRLTELI